jgi:hypothetical protein
LRGDPRVGEQGFRSRRFFGPLHGEAMSRKRGRDRERGERGQLLTLDAERPRLVRPSANPGQRGVKCQELTPVGAIGDDSGPDSGPFDPPPTLPRAAPAASSGLVDAHHGSARCAIRARGLSCPDNRGRVYRVRTPPVSMARRVLGRGVHLRPDGKTPVRKGQRLWKSSGARGWPSW